MTAACLSGALSFEALQPQPHCTDLHSLHKRAVLLPVLCAHVTLGCSARGDQGTGQPTARVYNRMQLTGSSRLEAQLSCLPCSLGIRVPAPEGPAQGPRVEKQPDRSFFKNRSGKDKERHIG